MTSVNEYDIREESVNCHEITSDKNAIDWVVFSWSMMSSIRENMV